MTIATTAPVVTPETGSHTNINSQTLTEATHLFLHKRFHSISSVLADWTANSEQDLCLLNEGDKCCN